MNNRYGELDIVPFEVKIRKEIGISVSLEETDNIPTLVREMIEQKNAYSEKITLYRNSHTYHFGNAAEQTATAIKSIIFSAP
jgi:hypothetical protein